LRRTKGGQTIDFAAMAELLRSHKLAVQYIPERLIVRNVLPATPSGKIEKFQPREMLREGAMIVTESV
jgi:cyclohexanecarboxylate-CoA ligase